MLKNYSLLPLSQRLPFGVRLRPQFRERNCGTSPMTHGLKELMQTALQQMASPLQEQNGLLMQKAAKRSMELNTPND